MEQGNRQSSKPPRTGYLQDLLIVILLFAIGLLLRWLYQQAVVFPPLDDPAFYLTTGENLVTGRGLEIDALWSYHILFPNVTHPSHEHWMPLPTGLIAAAFAIEHTLLGAAETTFRTGQLPGLLLGALLAPLTYLFGRRALADARKPAGSVSQKGRWIAFAAALLVAINATLGYQSASADSSAAFALLAALALATAVRSPGDDRGYFGTGLLIGLAYLARADGLLLLLAVPLAWWLLPPPPRPLVELPDNPAAQVVWEHLPRQPGSAEAWRRRVGPRAGNLLDMIIGMGLIVAPWLVRNYLALGTPLPGSVLNQAWLTDYIDSFNYWQHPTLETWMAQGLPLILARWAQALLNSAQVFLRSTLPWGLLALPGLWLLRREWAFWPALVYGILLFFGLAIVFPISTMSGTFYHSLGALMPFLALAAMYAVYRGIRRLIPRARLRWFTFAVVTAGLVVLASVQVSLSLQAVAERHQAEGAQFQEIASWLEHHAAPGDVVMTSQPYTLLYASGRPSIVLPGNEPPSSTWEAAQRYGARYLVITQTFGRYPQILHEEPDPRFRLV
jgi:hypothetical protein